MTTTLAIATALSALALGCATDEIGARSSDLAESPDQRFDVTTPTTVAAWQLGNRLRAGVGAPYYSGFEVDVDLDGVDLRSVRPVLGNSDARLVLAWREPFAPGVRTDCGLGIHEQVGDLRYEQLDCQDEGGCEEPPPTCRVEIVHFGDVGAPIEGSFEGMLNLCEPICDDEEPCEGNPTYSCDPDVLHPIAGSFRVIRDPDYVPQA